MAGCCSTCCGNWRRNRQPEEKPGQEKPGKNRDGGSQFPITPSVPVCGLLLPFPRSRGKVPKADGGGGRVGPALTPTLSRKRERVEKASGTISLSTPQGGANRTWLAPPRLSGSGNRDEESKQQHDEEHQRGQAGDQPCDAHQAAEGRFDAAACILIRHRTTAPRAGGGELGNFAIALPAGNKRHIRSVYRQGSGHAVRHVRVACAETVHGAEHPPSRTSARPSANSISTSCGRRFLHGPRAVKEFSLTPFLPPFLHWPRSNRYRAPRNGPSRTSRQSARPVGAA